MSVETDPPSPSPSPPSGSKDSKVEAHLQQLLHAQERGYSDIDANTSSQNRAAPQAMSGWHSSTSLSPATDHVFRAFSQQYILVPIGVSLGAFALGVMTRRHGLIFRGQSLRVAYLKLTASCVGGGTTLFWYMSANEHIRRLESDSRLRASITMLRAGCEYRHDFPEWKVTKWPALQADPIKLERDHGQHTPSGTGAISTVMKRFKHWTHHLWSTRAAQVYCSSDGYLRETLEQLRFSPHDVDLLITSASWGVQLEDWDNVSGAAIISTLISAALRGTVSSPAPIANTLLAVSAISAAICCVFRRYQIVTSGKSLEDKRDFLAILASDEARLANKKVIRRKMQEEFDNYMALHRRAAEQMCVSVVTLENYLAKIKKVDDEIAEMTASTKTPEDGPSLDHGRSEKMT